MEVVGMAIHEVKELHLVLGTVSTSSLIGVGIACGGNVLISLALTVQKLAHRRNAESVRPQRLRKSNSPTWNDGDEVEDGEHEAIVGTSARSRSGSSAGRRTPSRSTGVNGASISSPDWKGRSRSSSASAARHAPSYASVVKGNNDEPTVRDFTAVPVVILPDNPQSGSTVVPTSSTLEGGPSGFPTKSDAHARSRSPVVEPIVVPVQTAKLHVRLDWPSPPTKRPPKLDSAHQNGEPHQDEESEAELDQGQGDGKVEEGMYLRSKLWWLGMVLIAVGEGGNFLSYGFAPASVVAPLGTVALIANCVFAPLILRERFHKKELIGMALAVIGAVTVVWSSNDTNPRLDPSLLLKAILQIPFLAYTLLNVLLLIPLLLLSQSSYGDRYIAIDVGICALFGGYTVLSTKALSSLLSTMFLDAFGYWITWSLVAIVAATSVGQIRWLNRALMNFQSKEVIPTQFVFFSLAAIIGSAVLFQEFRGVPFSRFVNFVFGIATTFFGVHLLTSSPSDTDGDAPDRQDERPRPPTQPQRASSSASLNLLLPSAASERTPLLYASPAMDTPTPRRSSTAIQPIPGSYSSYTPISSLGVGVAGARQRIRLSSRASTDFPTLGLGSQAGFLLMATTPPPNSALNSAQRRERSVSRTSTAPPPPISHDQRASDEEAQASSRRNSTAR